jgi:hypothetical protein
MGGLLVAARVLLALVEREASHRVRRASGIGALVLSALFIGLAGLLFVLYAIVLALTPYLTPAGAAALVGAAMILLAAIIVAVTFRRPPTPVRRIEHAVGQAASSVSDAAMEAGRKIGAGIEMPSTLTVALAALIAGLVAGRKM